MFNEIKAINHQTRSCTVLLTLREAILTGKLKPGERLVQEKLAKQLNISRMPIREAINQLETEGFVKIIPYKGAVVTKLSLNNLEELYVIRSNLESLAASLAAKRLSDVELEKLHQLLTEMQNSLKAKKKLSDQIELNRVFHRMIVIGSRYNKLVSILDNLWAQSMRYRLVQAQIPGRLEQAHLEHLEIFQALCEGHSEKAAELVANHVNSTASALIASMSQKQLQKGGFK